MLRAIINALKAESEDEATKAAGKQAAGAAMVADGLFGLENPMDGKEKRVGIGGAIILTLLGVVIVVISLFIGAMIRPDDGDVIVTGEVVDIDERTSVRDGKSSTTYAPIVRFTDPATGESFEVGQAWSSGSRPTIGDTREVAFPPDQPASGRIVSTNGSRLTWIGVGVGVLLFLFGLGKTLVRLATLGVGVKLIMDGRKERAELGDDRSTVEALADGVSDVVADVSAQRSASSTQPPGQASNPVSGAALASTIDQLAGRIGSGSAPSTVPATGPVPPAASPGQATPPPPPPQAQPVQPDPTTPPPGWYSDPNGSGYRWWDGIQWTSHHQPAPQGPTT